MVQPTFLIIGTQKGGTTAAMHYLGRHPDVFMVQRELHFFDLDVACRYSKEQYEYHFKEAAAIGEKTPRYMYIPQAMKRISEWYPNIKLVVFLREPIARSFSAWNMVSNKAPPYSTTIRPHKENIERGFYAQQLEYIFTLFPRENIHIIITEREKKNPAKLYQNLCAFLGVPFIESDTYLYNVGKYRSSIHTDDIKFLYEIYKPHNERLYKLLGGEIPEWEDYYKSHGLKDSLSISQMKR